MKILIVEDEPLQAELLKRQLSPLKIETVIARDWASAMREMLRVPPPDLIFLDLMLPDTNGAEDTLNGITKLREINPNALIVVMTGMQSIELATLAASLGADAFEYKQQMNSQVELFGMVKTVLRNHPGNERQSINIRHDMIERLTGLLAG